MNQWTSLHTEALEKAQLQIPQDWTDVVNDLHREKYIERGRFVTEQYPHGTLAGWCFTPTARGMAVLYPMPPVTGSAKRLTEAQSWMD